MDDIRVATSWDDATACTPREDIQASIDGATAFGVKTGGTDWISAAMIERTLGVWGKKFAKMHGRAMTRADAVRMLRSTGGLGVVIDVKG